MKKKRRQGQGFLTLAEIIKGASSELFRWTADRKATVVLAARSGRLSEDDIESLGISEDELKGWAQRLDKYGADALRIQRLQCYEPERRKGNNAARGRIASAPASLPEESEW